MNDQMWFRGSAVEWHRLLTAYWRQVKPDHERIEREFDRLDPGTIQALTPEGFYHWLDSKYFFWKYTAANRLATTRARLRAYRDEDPEFHSLASIHKEMFCLDRYDIDTALAVTTRIPGLGTAGASGLLAVLFPK